MATRTLTLSDRKRRELRRTLRDMRLFMNDPAALTARAAELLRRRGEGGEPAS